MDPEAETLRAHPEFGKFKKIMKIAAADIAAEEAANAPPPSDEGEPGLLEFFDGLFKGKK